MGNNNTNWEKIGVYIACLGALYMFWNSLDNIKDDISDNRERTAKLEVKMENVEDDLYHRWHSNIPSERSSTS